MRSDLQKYPSWNADCEVLNEAIKGGLVDSQIGQLDYPRLIDNAALEYCEQLFAATGTDNTADFQNAGLSPKSIHFRSNTRGRRIHPETTAPYSEWWTELARFIVPHGHVGVIKAFEQYLAQREEDQLPAFVYTQNARWGIPGPWHTGLTNEIADSGIWHFRLRSLGNASPAWFDVIGASSHLPDHAYGDHPQEFDLWWPAGSAASQNMHWVIPGGHMLRVIYHSPEQAVRLEVAAKLKGWVQSDRTAEAAQNIRTNW